jgi:hypothetical protein
VATGGCEKLASGEEVAQKVATESLLYNLPDSTDLSTLESNLATMWVMSGICQYLLDYAEFKPPAELVE